MKKFGVLGKQDGITLMEIMIAVVLVAILSAMAVPRFLDFVGRMKARTETSTNVAYIRSARSEAISTGVPTGITFDEDQQALLMFQDTDQSGSYGQGIDSLIIAPIPIQGSTVTSNTFPNNCVIFNTDGTANASGQISFSACNDSVVTYTINVLASTGRVRLTM